MIKRFLLSGFLQLRRRGGGSVSVSSAPPVVPPRRPLIFPPSSPRNPGCRKGFPERRLFDLIRQGALSARGVAGDGGVRLLYILYCRVGKNEET